MEKLWSIFQLISSSQLVAFNKFIFFDSRKTFPVMLLSMCIFLTFAGTAESSFFRKIASGLFSDRKNLKDGEYEGEERSFNPASRNNRYPWLQHYDENNSIVARIKPPEGFSRINVEPGSFADWLRNLPLKKGCPPVFYYNGAKKNKDVHVAVIDMDAGKEDLQQCADSVIRLRAEYLWSKGLYREISFRFVDGDQAAYHDWIVVKDSDSVSPKESMQRVERYEGIRLLKSNSKEKSAEYCESARKKIAGQKEDILEKTHRWQNTELSSGTWQLNCSYENFREYLNFVFGWANTTSLREQMVKVEDLRNIQIGDVFIVGWRGRRYGHAVIVVDMVMNKKGEKMFLLAQGYMPAQEMHILKNPQNKDGSPWYPVNFGKTLITPEWTFEKEDLHRFRESPKKPEKSHS